MVAEVIPEKKYFKIGETSSLLGVKPHVLRYWETEFPQVRPFKSRTGQRLYRRSDVEALARIQKLLYEERFTIAGARQALKLDAPELTPEPVVEVVSVPAWGVPSDLYSGLMDVRSRLKSILEMVNV